MRALTSLAAESDDIKVEFDVYLPYDTDDVSDERRKEILDGLRDTEAQLKQCQNRVDKLNKSMDSLTNQADKLDYAVAVASGILTGLVDAFFVGTLIRLLPLFWGSFTFSFDIPIKSGIPPGASAPLSEQFDPYHSPLPTRYYTKPDCWIGGFAVTVWFVE